MSGVPLRVLFVSAELAPYAKVGGLADVAAALPPALRSLGCEVKTVVPCYRQIRSLRSVGGPEARAKINVGSDAFDVSLHRFSEGDPDVFLVDSPRHFDRDGIYMFADDGHRFIAYAKALFALLPQTGWRPDIVHCNDWQTALVAAYLRVTHAAHPFWAGAASIFTIHNLAYQGQFSPEFMDLAGLPWEEFDWQKMEFYGQVNLMKAGIVYGDRINTVSPTYRREIQTEDRGEGLEGALLARDAKLSGILNGLDRREFDPATDPSLYARYSALDPSGKEENKKRLLEELGLPGPPSAPLVGMVSRLTKQKGMDLLLNLPGDLWDRDFQFVLLGEGEEKFAGAFLHLAANRPGRVAVRLKFDEALARKIYAASDIFLMPSLYEPCGLGQMIALRYGAIPVARAVGGLADTLEDFNPDKGSGNAFLFRRYAPSALFDCLKRAFDLYRDEQAWAALRAAAMRCDFSWENSAKHYLELYKTAAREKKGLR